jgi:DNA-binding NarL/FixJ family response regulator
MNILIVDDSEAIRARLVTHMGDLAGVRVVGQAETVAQAIASLRQLKPHAMILDLRLPDGNGLDVLRLVQKERIPTAVIVLTNYPHAQYEKRARAAGAYAFLNKARDLPKIVTLLQELISGGPQPKPQAETGAVTRELGKGQDYE